MNNNPYASFPAKAGQDIRPIKNNFVRMKNKIIVLIIIFIVHNGFSSKLYQKEVDYPFEIIEVDCSNFRSGYYVIKTDSDYMKICPQNKIPKIDFNTHVLVGFMVRGEGCHRSKEFIETKKNKVGKAITCILYIEDNGNCRLPFPDIIRWVLIEKPPQDYSINVKIERLQVN